MIKRNIKTITTLALAAVLSIGMVTVTHADGVSNSINFAKSQQALKSSSNILLPKDKKGAVTLWAEALKQRNGAFRYAILNNDLKKQEYEKYNKMNWVIGGSSPKVVSYKINETNKIDDKNYEYKISYTLTDSTKALYHAEENIVVTELGQNCSVTKHDNYDYLPNITE